VANNLRQGHFIPIYEGNLHLGTDVLHLSSCSYEFSIEMEPDWKILKWIHPQDTLSHACMTNKFVAALNNGLSTPTPQPDIQAKQQTKRHIKCSSAASPLYTF
jgi:hypothetical protein